MNNKPFVIVNGPAVRSSTSNKGRSAESEEEEEKVLDYLSDKIDSETVLVSNEKLKQVEGYMDRTRYNSVLYNFLYYISVNG